MITHRKRRSPLTRAVAAIGVVVGATVLGACGGDSTTTATTTIDTTATSLSDLLGERRETLESAMDSLLPARLANASQFLAQLQFVVRTAVAVEDDLTGDLAPSVDADSVAAIQEASAEVADTWVASDIRACVESDQPAGACAELDFAPVLDAVRRLLDVLESRVGSPT